MEFLSKILPRCGIYVGTFIKEGKTFNKFYETVEKLSEDIKQYDSKLFDAYHACASYKEKGSRKADNAGWMRSIWLDIDVGKADKNKSYGTIKEAAAAVVEMCKTYSLPVPMLVQSGMGLHCYWVLDTDLAKEQWKPIVSAFASALNDIGFKHDPSRTKDASSVLRPVGSTWRKNGERAVKVLRDAPEVNVAIFDSIVAKFAIPEKPKVSSLFELSNDLGAPVEYPPSSAYQVIKFCPTLAEVAEKKGDVPEPLWRAMLGVVKNCTEGDELAHEWSKGDERYSYDSTQKKIDGWTSGPATCQHFSELSEKCNGCKHAEKVKSPIQLGMIVNDEEQEIEIVADVTESVTEETAVIDKFKLPKGFEWDGYFLKQAKVNKDGVVEYVPFTTQLFIITMRVRNVDGVMVARVSRQVYQNEWRTFEFETSLIAQKNLLGAAFAAHEIYTIGRYGLDMLQDYVRTHLENLRINKIETAIYDSYGWHEGNARFVIGNLAITKDSEIQIDVVKDIEGITGKTHGKSLNDVSGTAAEWTAQVNHLYNHKGGEAAQFCILAGFASPLIQIMGLEGWHGIPIGLSGRGGNGKTKVANVACSIYGPPGSLEMQANGEGTTSNARIQVLGRVKNLPFVFDEITGIPPHELAALFYSIQAGKNKIRLKQNGELSAISKLYWNSQTFITCQSPFEQVLNGVRREVHEATSLRCFSINTDSDKGWKFVRDQEAAETLLNTQYGTVGRIWLTALINKSDEIGEKCNKYVMRYAPEGGEENERYYRRLVGTVMFAGKLSKMMGLHDFDLKAVQDWAEEHIMSLRNKRSQATFSASEYLSSFLGWLINRTIVTDSFGDSRSALEHPQAELRAPPVARRVLDKAKPRLIVERKALADWCRDSDVDVGWMTNDLKSYGYIMENPKQGAPICVTGKMVRLGTGTTVQLPPVYALEFDIHKLSGSGVAATTGEAIDFDEAAAARKFKQK